MKTEKISFTNPEGQQLSALLDIPLGQQPSAYAIFAHCFTCSKNLMAVKHIALALTQKGIAVFRFDFAGLGQSEGEFSATNFSSNVGDLLAAYDYLQEAHRAPAFLIGHSLGGAAVIMAAAQLPELKGVVTIGAPADPFHVTALIGDDGLKKLEEEGTAEINIGGRPFQLAHQFVKDLEQQNLLECLKKMRQKHFLFMHSPQDAIVEIENAKSLYAAAFHPKSFISLDGADHLLGEEADARYVGEVIGAWSNRFILAPPKLESEATVAVRIGQDKYTTEIKAGNIQLLADEPQSAGGQNLGPGPYELVTAGLGACTAMTLRMYADHKGWPLEEVLVELSHEKKHFADMESVKEGDSANKIDVFQRKIRIEGPLSAEQKQRLLEIANRCPVHRTLHSEVIIETTILEE
ncbi:bifunctional alpha/beta hydrolase/OsmC family protein [Persicobacter sp. CCB-QB2]|uniref:bifunctional alpha/beta hydrolase/OsmC family protein n=1 Tax=Persicobacter sp. CCB-QB2 TaxID=1561025 RepID=UPI0006A984B4|nr:bifunctional alpha/beta hydrolase/OsmC family protein [Persicobacter sp. CCB-QB2]